jgi:hypothetical membrane protein
MGIGDEQGLDTDWPVGDVGTVIPSVAVLGIALTLGSTLLSTTLSPSFAWQSDALSNLGVTTTDAGTTTTVLLFNGGLIVGGAVGAGFAAASYRRLTNRQDRAVVALAGLSLVLMGLIGVFPQDVRGPHFAVAIGFFLLLSVTLWVDGIGHIRRGNRLRGALTVAGGTANVLAWVLWISLNADPYEGIAIPEMIGSLIFGVWLSVFAFRLSEKFD